MNQTDSHNPRRRVSSGLLRNYNSVAAKLDAHREAMHARSSRDVYHGGDPAQLRRDQETLAELEESKRNLGSLTGQPQS